MRNLAASISGRPRESWAPAPRAKVRRGVDHVGAVRALFAVLSAPKHPRGVERLGEEPGREDDIGPIGGGHADMGAGETMRRGGW
jgi:hypothetical protein